MRRDEWGWMKGLTKVNIEGMEEDRIAKTVYVGELEKLWVVA